MSKACSPKSKFAKNPNYECNSATGRYNLKKGAKAGPKKVRKADAPKRPLSGYMLFAQKVRADVKKAHPDATFGEIGKLLGAQWKSMSDSEKKAFNDLAAPKKAQYAEKAKAYKAANGGKLTQLRERVAKGKSGYNVFTAENHKALKALAQNKDLTLGEISKKVAAKWKALSPEEQQVFKDKAAALNKAMH